MRRIVFYGNCQAGALYAAYNQFVAPWSGDSVAYVNPYLPSPSTDAAALADASVMVAQIHTTKSKAVIDELRTDADRHLFPAVAALFLWPFGCQQHPDNEQTWYNRAGPYPGQMGDGFLNRLIKQHVDPDDAVRRYRAVDFSRVANLDRLFEMSMERQRLCDDLTGYSFADTIESGFRERRMFLTPDHPSVQFSRHFVGQIFSRMGADDQAINRVKQYAELFPVDELPLHPAVIEHFRLQWASANCRYRFINEGYFDFDEYCRRYMQYEFNVELGEGIELAQQHRWAEALPKLEIGLKRSPESSAGYRALAHTLRMQGDIDGAIEAANKSITSDPADPHAYGVMFHVQMQAGDFDAAESMARKVIALAPHRAMSHSQLCYVLERRNRLAEAIDAARAATVAEPTNATAIDKLNELLTHAKERQLNTGRTIDSEISSPSDLYRRSLALIERGELDDALLAIDRAIALSPYHPTHHFVRAHILERKSEFAPAVDALDRACELDKASPHPFYHRGRLLLKLERVDQAYESLSWAIVLDPWNPHILAILSRTYEVQGKMVEAIESMRRATQLEPNNQIFRTGLNDVLARRGALDAAVQERGGVAKFDDETSLRDRPVERHPSPPARRARTDARQY